jgi:hypothetical protein
LRAEADPTTRLCGVSINQFMRSNVARHHSSGPDEATPAESYSTDYRCIRSDGDALFDPCFYRYPVVGPASRGEVVSENRIWSKEDIVVDVHMLPETDSIFNRYIIAYGYTILDESVIPDITVRANTDVLLDMSERPYARAFADVIRFHQRLFVNKSFAFCVAHNVNASLRISAFLCVSAVNMLVNS